MGSVRDRIAKSASADLKRVTVEGIEGELCIAPMSARFFGSSKLASASGRDDVTNADTVEIAIEFINASVVEEDGSSAFEGPQDNVLRSMEFSKLMRLFNACLSANGLDTIDDELGSGSGNAAPGGGASSPNSPSSSTGPTSTDSQTNSQPETSPSGGATTTTSGPSGRSTPRSSTD
jgi:hypothetical protein